MTTITTSPQRLTLTDVADTAPATEPVTPPLARWSASLPPARFDAAEQTLAAKVNALRDAQARERTIEKLARERALFQLD